MDEAALRILWVGTALCGAVAVVIAMLSTAGAMAMWSIVALSILGIIFLCGAFIGLGWVSLRPLNFKSVLIFAVSCIAMSAVGYVVRPTDKPQQPLIVNVPTQAHIVVNDIRLGHFDPWMPKLLLPDMAPNSDVTVVYHILNDGDVDTMAKWTYEFSKLKVHLTEPEHIKAEDEIFDHLLKYPTNSSREHQADAHSNIKGGAIYPHYMTMEDIKEFRAESMLVFVAYFQYISGSHLMRTEVCMAWMAYDFPIPEARSGTRCTHHNGTVMVE